VENYSINKNLINTLKFLYHHFQNLAVTNGCNDEIKWYRVVLMRYQIKSINILFLLKVLIKRQVLFEEVEDFIENEIDTDRLQIMTFLQV
jgi:hypothetical protein